MEIFRLHFSVIPAIGNFPCTNKKIVYFYDDSLLNIIELIFNKLHKEYFFKFEKNYFDNNSCK
ncbi:MAG: hypothetical protein CO119_02480 [Flavobacteriales bacterium CG_4_9_14_3_um_filter_40_17]|nr:MAG: hypothetical protein CO119_02480 [Flavobacteriales bacterium CG_4_9_14_3_um_filter_40_17]